jgi:hypothetical protein
MDAPRGPALPIVRWAFFGNWHYGLCAVALSIEAALQQRVPVNGVLYQMILFFGTVLFYTHAYRGHRFSAHADERQRWYAQHHNAIGMRQFLLALLVVGLACYAAVMSWPWSVSWREVALGAVFPLTGSLYYGGGRLFGLQDLRSIGWSKPFVIGFVWAGVVTVYPVLFQAWEEGSPYVFTAVGGLLFLKNMMFVALLCILFDIKDQAADHRSALRTLVVQRGLRATLFQVVLPLALLGLCIFILYGGMHGFHPMKVVLNTLPFLALIAVVFTLRRRRPILYYLVVVDGLMLVKGVCGSIAMCYF